MIRNFYGIYLQDSHLASALNLIRYIGQPDWIRFTHITLRGPYPHKLSSRWLDEQKANTAYVWQVRLSGPGRFSGPGQNTILVAVDLLNLSNLFYKKDFKNGIPHLTLYDGNNPVFAESLLHMLHQYDFHRDVPVTSIMLLEKKLPPTKVFAKIGDMFQDSANKYIGSSHNIGDMKNCSMNERLSIIQGILDDNFTRWSDNLIRPRIIDFGENLAFDFGGENLET